MNFKNINKKILYLAIVLLILAGAVVVALKGFKVNLMLEQHESINFIIGKDFEIKDVRNICNEVFEGKKTVVRKVEVFSDAVRIDVSSITDEEKQNLVTKMNEKYGIAADINTLEIKTTPNVRIRDMVKPYLVPSAISILIIGAYLIIRFKKMDSLKLILKLLFVIVVTEGVIASVVAITRIPFSGIIVNLMTIVAIVELILYINKKEKEYAKMVLENANKKK